MDPHQKFKFKAKKYWQYGMVPHHMHAGIARMHTHTHTNNHSYM